MKIRLVFHVGSGILKFQPQNFELGGDPFPPHFGHFSGFSKFFLSPRLYRMHNVMLPIQNCIGSIIQHFKKNLKSQMVR